MTSLRSAFDQSPTVSPRRKKVPGMSTVFNPARRARTFTIRCSMVLPDLRTPRLKYTSASGSSATRKVISPAGGTVTVTRWVGTVGLGAAGITGGAASACAFALVVSLFDMLRLSVRNHSHPPSGRDISLDWPRQKYPRTAVAAGWSRGTAPILATPRGSCGQRPHPTASACPRNEGSTHPR